MTWNLRLGKGAAPIVVTLLGVASATGWAAPTSANHRVRDTANGLRIAATIASESVLASEPLNVAVALMNVSKGPFRVLSHIATHETHLDWYRFRLEYLAPDGKGRCDPRYARHATRDIAIADDRDKSIPVVDMLAPGSSITHTVDLQEWASRRINGATRIPAGTYRVSVTYRVTATAGAFEDRKAKVWTGTVESSSVPVTVTGPPMNGSCPAARPG